MNFALLRGLIAVAMLCMATISPLAMAAPGDANGRLYYEIGGGAAFSPPASYRSTNIGGGIKLQAGYACGKFDLQKNLENLFNQYKNAADSVMDIVVYAAESAIAELPMYVLQQVNPNLAHLFENAMAYYQELIRISVRSCQEMEKMRRRGDNPYDDWINIARANSWSEQADAGADVTEAEQNVYTSGGKYGVVWKDGEMRGGEGQDPIKVIGDTIAAGYEILSSGASTPSAPPGGAPALPALEAAFGGADAAVQWGVDVLGEMEMRTSNEEAPSQTPGLGLAPKVEEAYQEIQDTLTAIVNDETENELSDDARAILSAPGVAITQELIDALRALPASTQSVAVQRLAQEAAGAKVVEQALLLRRLLLSGTREPHIGGSPAWDQVRNYVIPELDQEIDSLTFENRVRQDMVSHTAQAVLGTVANSKEGVGDPGENEDSTPLQDGVIFKDQVNK